MHDQAELVDHVAAAVQLPKSQTDAGSRIHTGHWTPWAGEAVDLRGFGRFHLRHRQPRAGRNPRTGDTVQIPAKAVPIFTAGEAFQERVQSSAAPAGGACVRPADDVPVVPHQEACVGTAGTRMVYGIPGMHHRCPLRPTSGGTACGGCSGPEVGPQRRAHRLCRVVFHKWRRRPLQ